MLPMQMPVARSSAALSGSPKLSGAAPPNRASRATIAFLESDRPGAPRAGDAYGDIPRPRQGRPRRRRGARFRRGLPAAAEVADAAPATALRPEGPCYARGVA